MNEQILKHMVFNKLKAYYKYCGKANSKIDMEMGTIKKKIKEINSQTSFGFNSLQKFQTHGLT